MDINAALKFTDVREWREWLAQNFDSKTEVWLLHHKKRSKRVTISYDEALEEALCFGWIDGKLKRIDEDKFILRYSPRKANSIWSKINRDKAETLITQGRMTEAGQTKIEEAKRNGSWDAAYTSRTRDDMPGDLEEALIANPKAHTNFTKFANTYQNMYIGWVVAAKTEMTRKKRITEVVIRSALNKKAGIE